MEHIYNPLKNGIGHNIEEVKRQYEQTNSGYWFTPNARRFFKSRLTSHFRRLNDASALFITTEKGPNGIRAATLRMATIKEDKINIETIGEFCCRTIAQCKKDMLQY